METRVCHTKLGEITVLDIINCIGQKRSQLLYRGLF